MKSIALAAALGLATTTAFAGGLEVPVIEPEVVIETVEETGSSSSSAGLLVPLIIVALIAAAAS